MVARGTKLRDTNDAVPANEAAVQPKSAVDTLHAAKPEDPRLSQRKRPEAGRYLLQVDRQTKRSFETTESAEAAGLAIKTGHPIVQVSIYDSIDCVNKLVELPPA